MKTISKWPVAQPVLRNNSINGFLRLTCACLWHHHKVIAFAHIVFQFLADLLGLVYAREGVLPAG